MKLNYLSQKTNLCLYLDNSHVLSNNCTSYTKEDFVAGKTLSSARFANNSQISTPVSIKKLPSSFILFALLLSAKFDIKLFFNMLPLAAIITQASIFTLQKTIYIILLSKFMSGRGMIT